MSQDQDNLSNTAKDNIDQHSPSASRGSLAVIFLVVFIDLLGFGIVLPLLPVYADQFTLDEAGWQLGTLMASFSAMQFLFAPLWGKLSDKWGRRPVLMVGLAGSTIFYGLFGIATMYESFALLMLSRIGAGIAGATISTAQAYIADTTVKEKRSKGMALIGMAFGLGFTLGPLIGFLAVPSREQGAGPLPGFVAAALSLFALVLAAFKLPESLSTDSEHQGHQVFSLQAIRTALGTASIPLLLLSIFICIFSFANFETTLSLLIKESEDYANNFGFGWGSLCLTYAFIGLTLSVVQGGIVRRLSGKVADGKLAAFGAFLQVVGFGLMLVAINTTLLEILLISLVIVVSGFSFMQPSLNALISRRSDPQRQGMILGVSQSVSSFARIVGSAIGIPLLKVSAFLPYSVAAGLMVMGVLLILLAAGRGKDFTK